MGWKSKEARKAYNKAYYESHKPAIKVQLADYYQRHKEECRVYQAEYRVNNREKIRAKVRERQEINTKKDRERRFKRSYGITMEDFDKLLDLCKGKCPICKRKFTKTGKRRAVVHHCHTSGHVHGLICASCNLAEGCLGTPEVVLALYNYMMQDELLSYRNGFSHQEAPSATA